MRREPFSKWKLLGALFVLALLLDQGTKYLAAERLTTAFQRSGAQGPVQRIEAFWTLRRLEPYATAPHYVYRPLWRMNYVENPNAAFGFMSFVPPNVRHPLFLVISTAAIVFILSYYRKLQPGQRFLQVSLAFVLAGTVGNLVDRLARHYVIDFVEWYWWNRPDLRWPTFNVADSLLVVGIAMLLVHPAPKRGSGLDGGLVPGKKRTVSRV